jgi:hypothetical protein
MIIKIKYNEKTNNWLIFINKQLFLNIIINNASNSNSKNINKYLYLSKILRQFGIIKPLKK